MERPSTKEEELSRSASTNMVSIVRVRVTEGKTGLLFAESKDLRGLLVAERDMDALWVKVPEAIRDLYRAAGQNVVVKRAMDSDPKSYPFAAIPTELMAQEAAHH